MKKLSVQFHIMPNEIVKFLDESVSASKIFIINLGFINHFVPHKYSGDDLLHMIKKDSVFISILDNEPNLSCTSRAEFNLKNPGALYFTLGCLKENILTESVLSGFVNDNAKNLISLFQSFKKTLKRGCIVINQEMNTKAKDPSHMYSNGAEVFQNSGGV